MTDVAAGCTSVGVDENQSRIGLVLEQPDGDVSQSQTSDQGEA